MIARTIYNRPRYFSLVILCVIAVGINSFRNIPRQEDPTLLNFVATITTVFPGATPDRVEALVTRPLEDELRELSEIEWIQSNSSSGISAVSIKLDDAMEEEELQRAWSEVRDAIATVTPKFPPGVEDPVFDDSRLTSFTTIVALSSSTNDDIPLSLLHRLAQDFADRARNLPDTKMVEIFGEPVEEIRVEVDESALISRGLSLGQVAAALQAADAKVAAGRAAGEVTDLLIEITGDFDSMERVREVIVNTSNAGSATRIADIARVYKTAVSPPPAMAMAQGRPAILIGAIMEPGNQVDAWSAAFNNLVHTYRVESPAGLKLEVTYDQSTYARTRLVEVAKNLAIGIALVILVLLFTLGWRAAVVVACILPLCGFISLTVMERMGMALHQMSVTGLIVALGLLVDGSIVMTDEIRKRLLRGSTPLEAIRSSVDRLRVPLIASALTTVLAFLPMAVMPGAGGNFLGAIATAVIIMLATSTVLALAITPVLASWLLPKNESPGPQWWIGGAPSGKAGDTLIRALNWSLRHPYSAISLAIALPLTGFLAFPTLTAQFFPGTDRDQFYIQVKLADGRSIYDTAETVRSLDKKLRNDPLVRRVDWSIGESAPAFYYNMYRFKEGIPTWAEALVLTHDENRTDDLIRRLQQELDREYPQARVIVRGIDQGPPVMAPIEIEVKGPNLEVLQELGDLYRQRLAAIPDVTHTSSGLVGGAPKLVFRVNEDKLRLANLQLSDVAAALNQGLQGQLGGELLEGTERLPVRVRLPEKDWTAPERIADIQVPVANGSQQRPDRIAGIPLNALGNAALVPAHSPIARDDGQRTNLVQAYLTRGVLPQEALNMLQRDLAANPVDLPDGYTFNFGGDADERAQVVDDIMAPMGLILAALMATILLTFNSWRLSGVAVLVCVCSMGLSLLALAIFAYPFGIQALIGVIGSIGVSINAAIIIITALQGNQQAAQGEPLAICGVVMDSSRHIVSTTVTTFGGFLPLILEGSQFWPPFAMAIAGGVLLSTIISFFLVPPLFLLCVRGSSGAYRRGKGSQSDPLDYHRELAA